MKLPKKILKKFYQKRAPKMSKNQQAPVKALVQPDMNTMMLLGLGVLLVILYSSEKEIQEFLSPKSSSE